MKWLNWFGGKEEWRYDGMTAHELSIHDDGKEHGYDMAMDDLKEKDDEITALKSQLSRMREALEVVAAKKGMCIFGSTDSSEDPLVSFWQGSAYSFSECAAIAEEALRQSEGE